MLKFLSVLLAMVLVVTLFGWFGQMFTEDQFRPGFPIVVALCVAGLFWLTRLRRRELDR